MPVEKKLQKNEKSGLTSFRKYTLFEFAGARLQALERVDCFLDFLLPLGAVDVVFFAILFRRKQHGNRLAEVDAELDVELDGFEEIAVFTGTHRESG